MPARRDSPPTAFLVALCVFFFCSGLSALIYQILWLRMFGWVFGVTIHAASAVWATFMAGLAVGSYSAGRFADRIANPLAWFGAAEFLIGISAVGTPWLIEWLQQVNVALSPVDSNSLAVATASRVGMTLVTLIVPTTLMGATLPLVLKASVFRTSQLGAQVGLLYGSNAAGAIVGTLAAGLYLVPELGIRQTFLAAAGLNAIVGVSALIASRIALPFSPTTPGPSDAAPEASSRGDWPAYKRGTLLVVLGVFAMSGAVSMALEVVWFRVLILFLRPTVYSFSLMLATILGGIAVGSYLVAPLLLRPRRWLVVLAVLELAIGVAIAWSFQPLGYLGTIAEALAPLGRIMPPFLIYPLAGSLLAIAPTALLMGVAFPIGIRVWASGERKDDSGSRRIGKFYAFNVAGSIVGSLAGGFILLPLLGSDTALTLLGALSFCGGLALLAVDDSPGASRAIICAAAVAAFGTAIMKPSDVFAEYVAQRFPAMDFIWKQEGVEATATVHRIGRGEGSRLVMTVNGNHQAGTDFPTTFGHRRIGHLPMLLHPAPQDALVIGLGGGATAGAVSLHDNVSVDVVELAEAVVNGSRFFESTNYSVFSRPNVRIRVGDGRHHMMVTPQRYDVVTADVIQPIFAGAGNIYSVEYFRLMKRVLNPGGIVAQWIPGTEAEYKLIARTFLSVFPETTVWADKMLFVGSATPLKLSRRAFESKLGRPGHDQALRDMQIENFEALVGAFAAGPDEIRAFVGEGPILSDDRPVAEYFLSLPRDRLPQLGSLRGDVDRHVADR